MEIIATINARVKLMFDTAPILIDYWNRDYKIIDCNKYAYEFFGFDSKEAYITGASTNILLTDFQSDGSPSLKNRNASLDIIFRDGSGKFEFELTKLTGETVYLEAEGIRVQDIDTNEDIVITYAKDVTQIKKNEMQLNEQKFMELMRKMMDSTPILISIWDVENSSCIGCNKYLLDTFGIAHEKDYCEHFMDYNAPVQSCGADAVELNKRVTAQAYHEGYVRRDWIFILPNGEEIPTDSTLIRIDHYNKPLIIAYNIDLRPIKAAMESEESNKAKSRFLARMSHEIRTPLSAILGIAEVQLRNQVMPPHTEEAFGKIYDSSKVLLKIVNDILDFSRIEAGKMALVYSEYDVARLISNLAQLHLIFLEKKEATFRLHVDPNLPVKMVGDVIRIRQIITNLLTNAFKFTEAGTVDLSLHCEGTQGKYTNFIICVNDTGIGMSEAQINELKGDYVRLHEQEKPYVGGAGLGIPIVHSLAQMMGAHFDLKSESGKGTRAVIRIPQEISDANILGRELADRLQKFKATAWSLSKDLEFVPEPMPHGNVLVVDDVETNLHVAEAMLSSFSLTVDLCTGGIEAIEKIAKGKVYDVIFMDHMMPDPDGIKTVKIIRKMGYQRPIVALTANAVIGQAEKFMANGFDGFMAKPIDIKLLNSYLMRFVMEKAPH